MFLMHTSFLIGRQLSAIIVNSEFGLPIISVTV